MGAFAFIYICTMFLSPFAIETAIWITREASYRPDYFQSRYYSLIEELKL